MKRNPLLESNNFNFKPKFRPKKMAHAFDFDKNVKPKKGVSSITFNTNLKISNHTRNKLKAIVLLGNYDSQKNAIDSMCSDFIDNLTQEQLNLFNVYYNALEKRDVIKKNK